MNSRSILVVDDDPHIREVLRFALEKEGLQVSEAENGEEALGKVNSFQPDLIILDILMPEMSGIEMCQVLRKTSEIPIIFLSSRDEEIDRILGLEIGGDDYITKPFSPRELVARVKVILKRLGRQQVPPQQIATLQHNGLLLNPETYQVFWQGSPIPLTATEFNLMHTFLQYPSKVYTRDELIQADVFRDIICDRTIDSHIRRLRHKFAAQGCPNVVETVHGFGYKLGSCSV